MDQKPSNRLPLVRAVLSLVGVILALHLAQRTDVLSGLARPFTMWLLHLAGVHASQAEDSFVIGRLTIPWSRDCAGLNVLGILWAMTLWANRSEPRTGLFALRMILAVPAAFAANVARIFTLIGYRQVFFPAVESPQLHYFMGFLWLIPVVWFFFPRGERRLLPYTVETLHLATAFSLLAPLISAPGGNVVALCTLLLLANARFEPSRLKHGGIAVLAWMAAAVLIAGARMESLWLPWLILCPAITSVTVVATLAGSALLPGTIPLLAMHPVAQGVILLAACFWAWQQRRPAATDPSLLRVQSPAPEVSGMGRAFAVAMVLLVPFAASPVNALFTRQGMPPSSTMPRDLGANSYRVRLVGQAPDLDLIWFEPTGEGRHHTLEVCMRYRGVSVQPTRFPNVKTDGKLWMREFFLQSDGLLFTYGDYLKHTFLPFSAAGVHVIASCPVDAMSAEVFADLSERSAGELMRLQRQDRVHRTRRIVASLTGGQATGLE